MRFPAFAGLSISGRLAVRRNFATLLGLFALASCSGSYDENFFYAGDYVSGEDGGVLFVGAYRQRPSSVLKGEQSTVVTGSSLSAYRLAVNDDGELAFAVLARRTCELDKCDRIDRHAALAPSESGLRITLDEARPAGSAIAYANSGHDIQLVTETHICLSDTRDAAGDEPPFKISPDRGNTRSNYILYAKVAAAPDCLSLSGLDLVSIARQAGKPDLEFYLVDGVRDKQGVRRLLILGKDHLYDWEPDALIVATYSDGWSIEAIPIAALGDEPPPTRRYSFLDNSANRVLLDLDSADALGKIAKLRIYDRGSGEVSTVKVPLPR